MVDVAQIATCLANTPISLVSVVNPKQQRLYAGVGLTPELIAQQTSLLVQVLVHHDVLLVQDAQNDPRFERNSLVTGPPFIASFAGACTEFKDGAVAFVCVADQRPHAFTGDVCSALKALARQLGTQLELRDRLKQGEAKLSLVDGERRRLFGESAQLRSEVSALAQLHAITCSQEPVEEKIRSVLRLGVDVLGMQLGILSHIQGADYTVVASAGVGDIPPSGAKFPLGDTYCKHTLEASEPTGFYQAGRELRGHPCYDRFKLEAYLGAPVVVDGVCYGTVNFSSPSPRQNPFSDEEKALVRHFAEWLGAAREAERRQKEQVYYERLEALGAGTAEDRISHVFFERAFDPLCVADKAGCIQHVNDAWYRELGWNGSEVARMPLIDFVHRADRRLFQSALDDLQQGKDLMGLEVRFQTKSGAYRWLNWTGAVDAESGHLFAAARDVTNRRELDQMKDEFISTVNHELRTPLTALRGSLGLVLGGVVGPMPNAARDLLKIACDNTDRLVRLINDMLDVDRMASGSLALKREPTDLCSLAKAAMASNEVLGTENGVDFVLETKLSEARVLLDPDRIRQVLDNLLGNAARYARGSGRVSVHVTSTPTHYRLSVVDQGPGIPREFQERVFTRFARVDSTSARQTDGTGLGLAICRSIIDLHGGTMGYHSDPGEGAEFFFELPK